MDAPTSFFLNLERRVGESKQMLCLRLRDGRISHDVGEMREAVVDFYEKLYGAEATDQQQADLLLEDLPTLGESAEGGNRWQGEPAGAHESSPADELRMSSRSGWATRGLLQALLGACGSGLA